MTRCSDFIVPIYDGFSIDASMDWLMANRESHGRIQGRKGQALRQRRLKRSNYLCEDCLEQGITRLADAVDHIVPLHAGGQDVDSNTRNLCNDHHRTKTNRDLGYKEKRQISVDGWPAEG